MDEEETKNKNGDEIEKLECINIGVFGHIDHGKTTLLSKLSGKWTDTHSEELKRGITIKLGYADRIIGKPEKYVTFIDAPGHEMLMATMLSGAAIIDAAILVIAANEGIKPQTREHLMALQAKNVKNLIIVQNKIDLVSKEQAKKNYEEIKKFIGKKYENAVVIPVSALQEVNIDSVLEQIVSIPLPERVKKDKPIFVVARSFDVNRPGSNPKDLKGAVLGGALKSGVLKEGDEIEIKPGRLIKEANQYHYKTINTKIRSLFRGSNKVSELTPGGSMSIETNLDMSLGKADSLAGNAVSTLNNLPEPKTSLSLKYKLFDEVFGLNGHVKVEDIKPSETLMLSINTSITGGVVKYVKQNLIEMSLRVPVVQFKGDSVGIARNMNGHWRLIGSGEIV